MRPLKKTITPRKEPTQDRAKEKVELILEATTQLLEKDGFEKTSTNMIAEKAGISIGSLYQYFPTKDAIFSTMMKIYMDNHFEMIEKAVKESESKSLEEILHFLVSSIIDRKRKEVRFNKMFAQKMIGYNFVNLLHEQDERFIELFKEHLKPFDKEIRKDNLELSLYLMIQTMKMIPVAIMFQSRFKLDDPNLIEELTHLFYQHLKKDK